MGNVEALAPYSQIQIYAGSPDSNSLGNTKKASYIICFNLFLIAVCCKNLFLCVKIVCNFGDKLKHIKKM